MVLDDLFPVDNQCRKTMNVFKISALVEDLLVGHLRLTIVLCSLNRFK